MLLRTLVAGLSCVLVAACVSAPAVRVLELRAAVEEIRLAWAVPAIGLGVVDRGEIVFLGGFGAIDARAATEHDRFRAASISKLFTAQAIMKLAEAGKLQLDDDVARWVPAFGARGITLRHLLTHRSGLRDALFPLETSDPSRVQVYLDALAKQAPLNPPNAAFVYTDADFNVLGAVVERAGGAPYADYIQRNFFDPLALADSTASPAPDARRGIAMPFMNKPDVKPATPRPYDIAFAPSEGLVTSARDLTIWMQATLKQDPRLLSRASYAAMMVREGDGEGPGRYAGLGWQLREEDGRRIAEHGGSVRGFNALALAWPEEGRAVVILTNANDAPRWDLARRVDAILGPAQASR